MKSLIEICVGLCAERPHSIHLVDRVYVLALLLH